MLEVWRPVVGYEGAYEVSDLGRVRSLPGGRRRPRVLRLGLVSGGRYEAVRLCIEGVIRRRYVHHMVAEAFIGPRPEGDDVDLCHNDGDSLNNRPSNLRYDSTVANNRDSLILGRHGEASRSHCDHGHEFTPENTYFGYGRSRDGGLKRRRRCRTCALAASRAYKARRRALAAA